MISLSGSLEYIITSSCNVACPDCDRFCNYNLPYHIKVEDFEKDIEKWSKLLKVKTITLQGGEPTLHPHLKELLKITRKYFDNETFIQIITNCSLLDRPRNEGLIETLFEVQPAVINTVIHFDDKNIRKKLFNNVKQYIYKDFNWKRIDRNEFKCENVFLEMLDFTTSNSLWIPYNKIEEGNVKPYKDNNPDLSYERCGAQTCSAIFKGRLYKCPRSAILEDFLVKFNLKEDKDWIKYSNYRGINGDNLVDLQQFAETKIKKESEQICGMCPAYAISKPQTGVKFK